ncbi:MAG: polysaccharide biosynthesis protein [Lactobacillales bacterium]|nr:polysaccharide biosynthesis protein [Lactobacillales bacterium]
MGKSQVTGQENKQQDKMVEGSIWLSAGNLISRLLGAVYIIPWYAWMGENSNAANGLFAMGYNIYALFLLISTAGIPGAVAKQTAHYNSLNEYKVSRQLFVKALQAMAVLGVICAGLMYLAAPLLARLSGGGTDLIPVMRSLSIALLVFPCMSVVRGFFQGNNQMAPFAISQIFEQVARVFYMLLTAFIIMKVQSGNYVDAVVQGTFAAFIGLLASCAVLIWYLVKERPAFQNLERTQGTEKIKIHSKDLLLETVRQAVPFIIITSGIQIFKLIDQGTFSKIMSTTTNYSQKQLVELFSLFSANPDKLTMIIIALGTSVIGAGLPLITASYTLRDKRELAKIISNNLQLFLFIMLPSVMGMMVLAKPLYSLFYAPDKLGTSILAWSAVQALLLGFYMVAANMLQGMYQNRIALKYLGIGILVKLLFQYPVVRLFEVYGPILSTYLGLGVSCFLMIRRVHQVTHFSKKKVGKRALLLFLMSVIMTIGAIITRSLLYLVLSPERKVTAFIIILFVAAVGGAIYGFLGLKTRIADRLLGSRVAGLRSKFHIK